MGSAFNQLESDLLTKGKEESIQVPIKLMELSDVELRDIGVVMVIELWEKYFFPECLSFITSTEHHIHEVNDPLIDPDVHRLW